MSWIPAPNGITFHKFSSSNDVLDSWAHIQAATHSTDLKNSGKRVFGEEIMINYVMHGVNLEEFHFFPISHILY